MKLIFIIKEIHVISVSVFVFLILRTNQRNTKVNERTEDKNLSQEKRMNERTYVRTAKEKPEFLVSVFNVTKANEEES